MRNGGKEALPFTSPRSLRRCNPDQVPRDYLNPESRDTPGGKPQSDDCAGAVNRPVHRERVTDLLLACRSADLVICINQHHVRTMFEIAPKSFLSGTYVTRSPQQEPVELKLGALRERAQFELQGLAYRLYREGGMSGDFVLDRAGTILARAQKPSAFRDTFVVNLSGRSLELRRAGTFNRRFLLLSDGKEVGVIDPVSAWSRAARVDLPADWPFSIMLFVFWLAALMWRRHEGAAAG